MTRRSLRGERRDRGAAAVLVTVLLAGGVIMGMLALSVDVGTLMLERRQLQNGADATSLALASSNAVFARLSCRLASSASCCARRASLT